MTDRETFNGLIRRYRRLIFAVCNRHARRGLDANDLLQETTVTLWEHREKLMSITPPPKQAAWIWAVARSTCTNLLRQTPTTVPMPCDYESHNEDHSLHDTLHELIKQLSEPDHTIVTLYLEGYDYAEIGRRVGMTKNNVGVRLMRIKDKLRKQWNKTE